LVREDIVFLKYESCVSGDKYTCKSGCDNDNDNNKK